MDPVAIILFIAAYLTLPAILLKRMVEARGASRSYIALALLSWIGVLIGHLRIPRGEPAERT
ncbi:hypothetical protein AYO38_03670 [bacterium SCGC AG-212-C10]|nr:hypothetical protein AYO38_03670 [bacterium SCGC AG-212-C10]